MKKKIEPIDDVRLLNNSIKTFNNQVDKVSVLKLTNNQYSNSSVLAIRTDWNRFVSFCEAKHVRALPASITAVRMFLENESRHRKFASIRRYSVTIGVIHMFHSFPSPTSHRQIQFTLSEIRNQKSGDARQANALTSNHLDELSRLINKDNSLRSHRDLAIYYLMFECALKRSELKKLSLDDVVQNESGWLINIDKTPYQLSISATEVLARWIRHLNASHVFLFRRIDKHNNIGTHQLDDSSIYRILRRASDMLGLDKNHRFTGQSARVGATQELDKQGYNVRDIQDFGRWLSPAMPAQYLQMKRVAEDEKTKFKTIKPWT